MGFIGRRGVPHSVDPAAGSDQPFEKKVFYTKVSDQICAVGYYEE
jgi:hypothetical protein